MKKFILILLLISACSPKVSQVKKVPTIEQEKQKAKDRSETGKKLKFAAFCMVFIYVCSTLDDKQE